jgi:hypothetical protein
MATLNKLVPIRVPSALLSLSTRNAWPRRARTRGSIREREVEVIAFGRMVGTCANCMRATFARMVTFYSHAISLVLLPSMSMCACLS